MKNLTYFIQSIGIYSLYGFFKVLPLDMASAMGGWLGRTIGPRMGASKKALSNLKNALPGKTDEEYNTIITGMWDNLARVIAEYPHLAQIGRERVTYEGHENIIKQIQSDNKPSIIFTAHMANWEICGASALLQHDLAFDLIYRAPNNPWVDTLLNNARSLKGRLTTIPKSTSGARQIFKAMKNGHNMGILIDQKYNEGIAVPFFGTPAMTSPAFVELCQKFDCPLIPVRMERLDGAHFKITVKPPMTLFNQDGSPINIETAIQNAHILLEKWISQRPEQWLWLHRRWSEKADTLYNETQEAIKEDNKHGLSV